MLNLAIACDYLLFSQTLKQLLQTEKRFNVVGVGKNEHELVDIVCRHNANLAIVGFKMPLVDKVATCKKLRYYSPNLKIIVVAMFEEAAVANQLKNIGVNAYICETYEDIDFISAIYTVWEGNTIFPEYSSTTTNKLLQQTLTTQQGNDLTIREKEIIALIGSGFTSVAIAAKLFISINTVKEHRKNIFKKLNLNNVQQLVAYAILHRLC